MKHSSNSKTPGFTLTEMVVVLAILSILMTISLVSYHGFRDRADAVACIGKMRSVALALEAYTQDQGHWPQASDTILGSGDEERVWEFWLTSTEEYGLSDEAWMCPTHMRSLKSSLPPEDMPKFMGSYVPTHFDEHQFSPYRWRQPWLIERGDFHGNGGHMLMPDGSINSMKN